MGAYAIFARAWVQNFWTAGTSAFGILGALASILALAGVTLAGAPAFLILLPIALFFIVFFVTKPPFPRQLKEVLNTEISPEELDSIVPKPDRKIGLVGISDAGKSTFRYKLANKFKPVRTNKPTVEIVMIPRPGGSVSLALLDSVGERLDNQLFVPKHEQTVVFFLDHAAGAGSIELSAKRRNDHLNLANEISKVLSDPDSKCNELIIVANKSDRWKGSQKRSKEMSNLCHRIEATIRQRNPNIRIKNVLEHSNFDDGDVVRLSQGFFDE